MTERREYHTTPVAPHLQASQDRHNELVDIHNNCLDIGAEGLRPEVEAEFQELMKALVGLGDAALDEETLRDMSEV